MPTNRLLIVEDDYDVAEMLLMYFTSHRYEVYHADSGIRGVDLARTKFPNLILLDVMMPEMNGYEVCAHLRKQSLTKHIPVIFLTQRDERADRLSGLELGADDYIAKPFNVEELRLRVQRSIERATRESLYERRTGLPTTAMIEAEIEDAQKTNRPYHQLQLELVGFSAFTDQYGFMAADQVIAHAAKTIREALLVNGTPQDFIGIREDQFVVMSYADSSVGLPEKLIAAFNKEVRAFYTFTDVEQGGILQNDGQPSEQLVPLMTLKTLEVHQT
ncbi:MAG: response regulator [Phototrophicaceae bacterium]|jgi:DNA-binding response OmpR family regulator